MDAYAAKAIYLNKARDALRDMSKWLQDKQMSAFEVTYQGKAKLAQKIPEASLREDEQLLMWYDHALTRVEDNL